MGNEVSGPLVLDFDSSVGPLPGAEVLPLDAWQERVRFACSRTTLEALDRVLSPHLSAAGPLRFLGSGDFHHVTYLLIRHLRSIGERIHIVVFDNHPDNMRYPLGIHCGSWVSHVSRLDFVASVHVAGIASTDVEGIHALENRLRPLRSGKVTYWCVGRNTRALTRLAGPCARSFDSTSAMLDAFGAAQAAWAGPVYLSIDKDVLSPDEVHTNWDQGVMRLDELKTAIERLRNRVIAADVVGEISSYVYRSRFKRFLSGLDAQPRVPAASLAEWQGRQHEVNRVLLSLLGQTSAPRNQAPRHQP